MDLNHEFVVNVPIDQAWQILTDLERIAPCLPGAQLTEIEGDTYRGQVKIKVGPILAQFKGQASFVSRDDNAHKATLKGEGRDTTGKGNASAMITAELTSITPTSTKCTVHTDLSISGKVAQFSENLNQLIAASPAIEQPTAQVAVEATATATTEPQQPVIRKIDGPEVAPLNLLDTAGSTIAKRAIPAVIALAVLVFVLVKLF
jgi:carbon monoxide dehydrogenase subunit G